MRSKRPATPLSSSKRTCSLDTEADHNRKLAVRIQRFRGILLSIIAFALAEELRCRFRIRASEPPIQIARPRKLRQQILLHRIVLQEHILLAFRIEHIRIAHRAERFARELDC